MPDFLIAPLDIAPEFPWLMPLFAALFGACVGSFLNVVIYRLPRGLSVSHPSRSFCPACGAAIPWYLNVPLLSWLLLRGRAACCGARITARYWWVELLTAGLFAALVWCFGMEPLPVVLLLALWVALMLTCLFIDAELMIVLPGLAVAAALVGLAAVWCEPLLADAQALEPWEGCVASLVGAGGGFALFALVALAGRLLFGTTKKRFDAPQCWRIRQAADGEDIELQVGEESLLWSTLFNEPKNRLRLLGATEAAHAPQAAELILSATKLRLPSGKSIPLEQVEELSGTCCGYQWRREAMGSGDAWLAMAIGALCGWQGVVFALVGGSILGLLMAAVQRVGFGRPMPFGPALISAALLWLFAGETLMMHYEQLWGL